MTERIRARIGAFSRHFKFISNCTGNISVKIRGSFVTVSISFHVETIISFFQVLFPFMRPVAWILTCMLHTTLNHEAKQMTFELVKNYFIFSRT